MDGGRRRAREVAFLAFAVLVAAASLGGTLWVFLGGSDDAGGNSRRQLEAGAATPFHAPESYDLATLVAQDPLRCGPNDATCIRGYLVDLTKQYGPRPALALIARYEREAKIAPTLDDHNLAHRVGRQTAEEFGANVQSFNLCTNDFNYGCPHGFFEYVLGRAGTAKEAAELICESLDRSPLLTAKFSCYHGVGHGVMMAEAYDLNRSLDVCDTLPNQTGREGCWQGVFMENVNAGVRNEARKGVFRQADPLAPCDGVGDRYRHQCFINHAGWLMHVTDNDVGRASRMCLDAPGGMVSSCMQSIGLMVTNPAWQPTLLKDAYDGAFARDAWRLCSAFPAGNVRDCVVAGVDNLGNFDRLNVTRSAGFCSNVASALQTECFRTIGQNLGRLSRDAAVRRQRCSSVPARYVRTCLDGAGVPA